MVAVASHVIEGHVSRGFEPVREAFEENFARRARRALAAHWVLPIRTPASDTGM
jgi:hypothetical protein